MQDWLIAGWMTAGVLYFFGMLATWNTIRVLKNSIFQDGSAPEVTAGLLALVFWPIAQIVAIFTIQASWDTDDWEP